MGDRHVAREAPVPDRKRLSESYPRAHPQARAPRADATDRLGCVRSASAVLDHSDSPRIRTDLEVALARQNFGHEKRQRELARAKKKAEKLQRKLDRQNAPTEDATASDAPDTSPEESQPLEP